MNTLWLGPLAILVMSLAILLTLETGHWFGQRRFARDPDASRISNGAVEGAVFGLMGLLIAFTFSGAASRFDARRSLIVEEANDIGTAWLRLDLLPVVSQPPLREKFREYVDARIAAYRKMPDLDAVRGELARAAALQNEIWKAAVAACRDSGSAPTTQLLLPAINEMIDITTTRTVAAQTHAPLIVYVMLGVLVLTGSLLAGYGLAVRKAHNWFHAAIFSLIMALAVYVILDFEFPRFGLIRIDAFDQVLVDVHQSMNP